MPIVPTDEAVGAGVYSWHRGDPDEWKMAEALEGWEIYRDHEGRGAVLGEVWSTSEGWRCRVWIGAKSRMAGPFNTRSDTKTHIEATLATAKELMPMPSHDKMAERGRQFCNCKQCADLKKHPCSRALWAASIALKLMEEMEGTD